MRHNQKQLAAAFSPEVHWHVQNVACMMCSLPLHDLWGGGAEVAPCQRGYPAQMAPRCRYSPLSHQQNHHLLVNSRTVYRMEEAGRAFV